jgi:hypothetical protein
LFWDIETSPNVVLSWRTGYKITIDHDNILHERAIICIGYKWEGDSKVHALTWDNKQSDRAMLEEFLKVAAGADELVAHNGDQFDMPWVKARCAYHGLMTFPDYKTVDTLQWARRRFLFNSNRLDYLGKFLGVGGKIKTEFGLWKSIVLERDKAALKRMVEYCKRDVAMLEKVYAKLAPHMPHKTHAGVMAGNDPWSCPVCSSLEVLVAHGTRFTANGSKRHRMQCKKCYKCYQISDPAHRNYLEAKKLKSENQQNAAA